MNETEFVLQSWNVATERFVDVHLYHSGMDHAKELADLRKNYSERKWRVIERVTTVTERDIEGER